MFVVDTTCASSFRTSMCRYAFCISTPSTNFSVLPRDAHFSDTGCAIDNILQTKSFC